MALAGEAAVRIVPSLKGFHGEAARKLQAKKIDFNVNVGADTSRFHREMEQARLAQEARPITLRTKTDWAGLQRDLSEVRHIFERNNLVKGVRLNIKILGLDALPALAYAAGSAASGLDALAKSAFVVPGALSGVGAAAASLAIGLSGVGDAFKDYGKAAEDSSKHLKDVRDAQRDLSRAQRDVSGAIRDQRRELEDLNAELRRSTLDEADAILNLQESADRLRQGGFKTITEYQRAQLRFLRDVESLKDVRKSNIRLLEDTNEANEKGILQGDQVVAALDKVTSAVDRLNEAQKEASSAGGALGNISPNAKAFIEQAYAMKGAWDDLRMSVQDNLFDGLDQSLADLGTKVLPGLKVGLSQVAGGLNSTLRETASSVASDRNGGLWASIFGNTTTGLETFKRGLDPMITGLSQMAEVGSRFLPRLGAAFTNVGRDFDAWTAKISSDGTLEHWIDQGLDSLTSLGNLAKNLGSVISSVGEAFNVASGTEGGFIGYFDRELRELAEYLRGEGRVVLTDYFHRARDLIHTVMDAFSDMRPLINSVIEAARQFSQIMLPALGGLLRAGQWIEEHTGLITKLFMVYAGWRTIAPMIDATKNAWKNYVKIVDSVSRFGPAQNRYFQGVTGGLQSIKTGFNNLKAPVYGATSQLKAFTGTLNPAAAGVAKMLGPMQSAAGKFDILSNRAHYATRKADAFKGMVGGVINVLGPALLGVAISAGIQGLMSLGDAHKAAEDAARRQADALGQLKDALDEITGAATAASLETAARVAQEFDMGPVVGKRNVLDDVVRSGLASPDQLISATLPQNQQLADEIDRKAIAQAADKIKSSDVWDRYGERWSENGVTPEILARAAKGEPEALKAVEDVERLLFGKPRREFNLFDRARFPNADATMPSVADLIVQAGIFDEASVGLFLGEAREQNLLGGRAAQQRTQAVGGTANLTPAGQQEFGKFGATNAETYLNADGIGSIVVPNDPGEIDPAVGQVVRQNDNQWQINLTPDATEKYIQGFARGGLIGGVGTGTSDSNLLMASRGEFITRKDAVDYYGADFFARLNGMQLPKFNLGGFVQSPPKLPNYDDMIAPPDVGVLGAMASNVMSGVTPPSAPPPAPVAPKPAAPPPPPAPKPAAPAASAAPAAPAAPSTPKPTSLTPTGLAQVQPGPLSGAALQRAQAVAQSTGMPLGAVMQRMPSLVTPYTGLPANADIKYGGEGFPSWVYKIADRFGVQASTYAGHQVNAEGFNKGIDWSGPVENMRAFAAYLTSSGMPGLEQVIFMDARDGAKFGVDPGDRGPNQTIEDYYDQWWATHTDHVHTRMSAAILTPEEMAVLAGGTSTGALLPGILGATGLPSFRGTGSYYGSAGSAPKRNGLQALTDYFTNMEWLQPENVERFLTGQARNVGSSLLNIGTGFLAGATGLDFSGLIGTGQEIGNFVLGAGRGGGGGGVDGGYTGLNAMTDEEINRYLNGQGGLGVTGGLDGLLGSDISSLLGSGGMSDLLDTTGIASSWNPGGGAEQWRPVVRRVLETYGPLYKITNLKAWEDAIVKQIQTESNGDPTADNPNDSNGQGGKQHVSGLLQFLPETFAANNITGGDYLDPVAQIAAVIPYVMNKYGVDANGAPNQIGRGVGYARGGKIKGVGGPRADKNLIRVSRGEFLHSANVVDHYGADFMSRLNSRQIPKESLPGFAGGMWWNPIEVEPAPAPAPAPPAGPPPTPTPAPPPPPSAGVAGQSAGPLPVAGMTPSTGGAPGSGATAPAPDPGALPAVSDALAGIGGMMGGGGLAQPGATPGAEADPRGTLGAAPTSQDHTNPALAAGIKGGFDLVGSLASTAINAGAMAGTMGASAVGGGMGAGQAGQIAEAGAKIAGDIAVGAVNVLSSLLVGTATNGSTASASGVPLLPQRQPMQTGVPAIQQPGRVHNGDIYLTNMDDYRRTQERMDAQAQMPFIGKY